jgi:cytochrome c peroxidase
LSNYQRSLVSGNSRFDKWYYGIDPNALTAEEINGWQIFNGEGANCSSCHSGFNFTNGSYQNIGLYQVYDDEGRGRITLRPEDDGKFKVPSLRNVTMTAPYMHDGSIATLEEVVDHFMSGGVGHPNQHPNLGVFTLSTSEKADLIAFLGTLEGETVGVESFLP